MNSQPIHPQSVVYNINNTNGNNYVNNYITSTTPGATMAECSNESAESQNEASATLSHTCDCRNNVPRSPVLAHPTSTKQIGFDQLKNARNPDYAQSPNKETVAGMTKAGDVAQNTRREDSIFEIDDHSSNKTPAKECATTETNPIIQPHSSTQFRIPVQTDQQGVVVFHRGLVPYLKSGLSVTHANQYWSYYAHILPGNNLSLFPAITAENIKDFLDRLNIIRQEVLSIGKATFEAEVVSAFNRSGHTNRGQPITCTKHVEELMRTWEGNVLSCLQLTWMNIHSLNTENSVFLKETLPLALVVHGATHDPPYTISNETNCKFFGKK